MSPLYRDVGPAIPTVRLGVAGHEEARQSLLAKDTYIYSGISNMLQVISDYVTSDYRPNRHEIQSSVTESDKATVFR